MARSKKLTPAEVVIAEFGIRPLAREIPIDPSTIVRWRQKKGGLVPSKYHKKILDIATRQSRTVTPTELIYGREVARV